MSDSERDKDESSSSYEDEEEEEAEDDLAPLAERMLPPRVQAKEPYENTIGQFFKRFVFCTFLVCVVKFLYPMILVRKKKKSPCFLSPFLNLLSRCRKLFWSRKLPKSTTGCTF